MKEPIRPAIILIIISHFPALESDGVKPVLRPRLVSAETVSKSRPNAGNCGSVTRRQKVMSIIQPMLSAKILVALRI